MAPDSAPSVAHEATPTHRCAQARYKKSYKDADDENARHALFTSAQARVKSLNKLNGQPAFGINWMSDRHEAEHYKKGLRKPKGWTPTEPVAEYEPRNAAGINWRQTEAVTAIKNQGQCGSCWAFSATEAIESQMILGTGGKFAIDLSPQQIASCAPSTGTYGCLGCEGGFTEGAYEYVKNATGLSNSFFIPYGQSLTEQTNTLACPTAKVAAINGEYETLQGGYATVSGYSYATAPCTSGACDSQDLAALQSSLEHTPVSVCVNAESWNDYTGGVMTSAACGPMGASYQDHCVMATGFNTTAPTPYWARARGRTRAAPPQPPRARAPTGWRLPPIRSCATRGRPSGARTGTSTSRWRRTRAASPTTRRSPR